MPSFRGRVVNGRVEVTEVELPEDARVAVVLGDYIPTKEEEAQIQAAIDEADRDNIPNEEFRRKLIDIERKFARG